jgi:hypothetical protein
MWNAIKWEYVWTAAAIAFVWPVANKVATFVYGSFF